MDTFLESGILSSCLRWTTASLSEENLSISHIEMVNARLAAAWSVYTFSLASPTMTRQSIVEGGQNEDVSGFRWGSNLSLDRWVETRVVGWGYELMVAA